MGAYMHACVCREWRAFVPTLFIFMCGSEGTWLITQHYCTSIAQMQFLAVKEVIKGEIQPLDQLPHCHDVDGIVKVCMRMHVVHAFYMLCIYICINVCGCEVPECECVYERRKERRTLLLLLHQCEAYNMMINPWHPRHF